MLKLSASAIGLQVMDRLRHKVLKRGILIDEAESDVLALFSFPKDDRPKIDITNRLLKKSLPILPEVIPWCRARG